MSNIRGITHTFWRSQSRLRSGGRRWQLSHPSERRRWVPSCGSPPAPNPEKFLPFMLLALSFTSWRQCFFSRWIRKQEEWCLDYIQEIYMQPWDGSCLCNVLILFPQNRISFCKYLSIYRKLTHFISFFGNPRILN